MKNWKKKPNFLFWSGILLVSIGVGIFYVKNHQSIVVLNSTSVSHNLNSPTPSFSYAKVTKIIDGDTFVIDTGQHVRYIGVNTPEIETNECYATEAGEINEDMIIGREVRLEKDTSDTDKYGRLLRYVYVDEGSDGWEMVNNELVKIGLAKVETVPPDTKHKNDFANSENYAKENKLGLWGKCL